LFFRTLTGDFSGVSSIKNVTITRYQERYNHQLVISGNIQERYNHQKGDSSTWLCKFFTTKVIAA
jgi:hypothetical protein